MRQPAKRTGPPCLLILVGFLLVPALLWAQCNPVTGLASPLPICSETEPCTRLGGGAITAPTDVPVCRTSESGRPFFDDGPPKAWTDPQGVKRYACVSRPSGASAVSPRPLIVFFHGGQGNGGSVYDHTLLRAKAESFELSGRADRPGFFLVSVQGRNLRSAQDGSIDGPKHDHLFRDLAMPSGNPDIANTDRLIDELVSTGTVDRTRIYVMGWSNGGFFAQMYAVARRARSTPQRNRVAATAVYSAADPFNDNLRDPPHSCQLDPYPTSTVPILLASRACDILACDLPQLRFLELQGLRFPPGYVVEPWIWDLATKLGNPNVSWRIIRGDGPLGTACTPAPLCPLVLAFTNHLRWPDGVADGSGIDHEVAMLEFLRDHPLPDRTRALPPRQ